MADLNKKTLEHLAELARIDLKKGEEEKLLKDLQNILKHFEELQALDTSNVQPMIGGTDLKNVLREDRNVTDDTGKGPEAFPEKEGDYLKVPPVF
jgi:aspartyl/glutamyl-tRNA(Asn/Gln) amidotransferase C subunit